LSAFPTLDELRRLARFHLDDAYAAAMQGLNLSDAAFKLIDLAEARGEIPTLLTAAQAENESNPALRVVVDQLMPPPAPVPPPTANEPAPKRRPPLSVVERTELYKQLKQALVERRWQRA